MADLHHEHGLKTFNGAGLVFGVLWGLFLALLAVNPNAVVSGLALAMLLSYVLRYRIDCLNHGVAATLVFLAFLAYGPAIDWRAFLFFFAVFSMGGFLHDSLRERPRIKRVLGRRLAAFFEYRAHIYAFPFFYSLATGAWLVFFVASAHMLSYEFVRQHYERCKEPEALR